MIQKLVTIQDAISDSMKSKQDVLTIFDDEVSVTERMIS
jgi:hypothetical protein